MNIATKLKDAVVGCFSSIAGGCRRVVRCMRYNRARRGHKGRAKSHRVGYERCFNCGQHLQGNYCHNCGQYARDINPSFGAFINQYFQNSFQWDGKFFLTVRTLLTHPGRLSCAFTQGHISRYVFPLKIYMFVAVIFGFAIIASINGANKQNEEIKSKQSVALDSIIVSKIRADIALDTIQMERVESILSPQKSVNEGYAQFLMGSLTNFSSRLPIVFMFAMPFFAVLTRLFFRRRYERYTPHLIYAIHVHTAFFIVATLTILFSLLYSTSYISWAIFGWFVWYSLVSSMRFFGSTWWASLLKGGCVLFLYLLFCVIVLIGGLVANVYYDSLITGVDLNTPLNS